MILISKKFFIILFLSIIPFYTQAKEAVAYLDIDYVFHNSNLGKKIVLELNEQKKNNLLKLKKKEVILAKNEKDLINKKKNLSENEFKKKLEDLSLNIKSYKKDREQLLKNFEQKKNEEIKIFFNKVNPILKTYMSQNSIKIVLDKKNVLIANDTLDITDDIYNLINKELN